MAGLVFMRALEWIVITGQCLLCNVLIVTLQYNTENDTLIFFRKDLLCQYTLLARSSAKSNSHGCKLFLFYIQLFQLALLISLLHRSASII